MMVEKFEDNYETDLAESEISDLTAECQKELDELKNGPETIDVSAIVAHRERLLIAIKTCDIEVAKFEANKSKLASNPLKKPYLDEINRIEGIISDQLLAAGKLRSDFEDFCTFKKERIASQRQHVHDVLLPKAKNAEEKLALETIEDELERIHRFYVGLSSFGNALYSDVSKIIQSKKASLYHRVIKDYPKKRYGESSGSINKESISKAEDVAKNGTPRSRKNAAKYFGGAPIMEKGKCSITDAAIKRNKEIMDATLERIKTISESRSSEELVKWTDGETIIVPDLSEELLKGDEMVKNIRDTMVSINVDTKYLDRAPGQSN